MFTTLKRYTCINGTNYSSFSLRGEIYSKPCNSAYNIFISFGTSNSAILSIFFFSKVHIEFKMKIMRPVFARIINKLIDCLID